MPVWLQIIAANGVICLACYAIAAHKAYKSTEKELEEAKRTIRFLENELRKAKGEKPARGSHIPDFLLADDPMGTLLNEVGKVRK